MIRPTGNVDQKETREIKLEQLESEVLMIASLLGIVAGFVLIMLGLILGVHSEHTVVGVLIMFAGLVSMLNFLPHFKDE